MAQAHIGKNDDATAQQDQRVESGKNASFEEDQNTVVKSTNTERARHGGYEHEAPIKNSDESAKMKNEDNMESDISKTDLGDRKPSVASDKDAEIATLKMKLRDAELKIASHDGSVNQLTEALEAHHDRISQLEKVNKDLEARVLTMTSQLQELNDEHKKSSAEVEKLKKEKERDKKQLVEYDKQSNELRSKIEEFEREKISSQLRIEEMRTQLRQDRQISLLGNSESSLTSSMARENERLRRLNSQLNESIEALKREVSCLQVQNELSRQDLDKERRAKERNARLAEERLHETERAQAMIGVFQIMMQRTLGGVQVVDPNLRNAEVY